MTARTGIFGASGYTGAELVRLVQSHPQMEIAALSAERHAGSAFGEVFPQFAHLDLPRLQRIEEVALDGLDLLFCALPHGITQDVVARLPKTLKIVDLSADFRLRAGEDYHKWYGAPHRALDLQREAVYGLPEHYRDAIRSARLVANTGCYVAASLLPLLPLLKAGLIDADDIVIDAKSGATGAGRAERQGSLFCEVAGGFHAYGIGGHRHCGELDQELSRAAGQPVCASFTPHLLPQARGILATIYVKGTPEALQAHLAETYRDEPFVHVLDLGSAPQTRHVTGSNLCRIGVVADRRPNRAILVSVLDNLMKGASGQAVQNANLMLGFDETAGLSMAPVFP